MFPLSTMFHKSTTELSKGALALVCCWPTRHSQGAQAYLSFVCDSCCCVIVERMPVELSFLFLLAQLLDPQMYIYVFPS